jgi:hypothetical protein
LEVIEAMWQKGERDRKKEIRIEDKKKEIRVLWIRAGESMERKYGSERKR